ncbi:MAG: hypothetical protein GY847_01625 [Proteobacteria bacterium]|nr:hypothetical protein [Pseudomonadota bacterium]
MKLEAEQMAELEKMAALQFTLEECATMLSLDAGELIAEYDEQGEIYETYERGRLRALALIRAKILGQAKEGSSKGHKQMLNLIEEGRGAEKPAGMALSSWLIWTNMRRAPIRRKQKEKQGRRIVRPNEK